MRALNSVLSDFMGKLREDGDSIPEVKNVFRRCGIRRIEKLGNIMTP